MVRPKRVLSFMSEWGGQNSSHRRTPSSATTPSTPASPTPPSPSAKQANASSFSVTSTVFDNQDSHNTQSRARSDSRASSRPASMIQTYQPPVMDIGQGTLPELQRIFTFMNSHSNKLYQEGYFLKFHDTDTRGRPALDRVWQECFAQLVGTILSLWDASELDNVSGDYEVLPTFINLTDAAIHMMPSMVLSDGKKLDNILSVSTAASNKYLFHFNSFNSLTQWTAGIRLAMYEHTSLQEAYTGALIAGKGRQLNNIRILLDRQRPKYEDWVRVRFGAGTPWRRCWCVVSPPDEKEFAKLQKTQKKQDLYNRSPVILKGDIKFYDAKKVTKKSKPIASVKDAYSCYAIYPQSNQLIDHSTLVKVEGKITVHSSPEKITEGFVFIMPETRPAVSGFEIMLQYLFPVFDTFALYGRPNKLIADVLDPRGLMFAMPPDKRYGYLEMWDIVGLIHTEGSQTWSERQWRKQMKDLTSTHIATGSRTSSRPGTRRNTVSRTSMPPSRNGTIRFEDHGSIRSQPTTRQPSPTLPADIVPQAPTRVDSAPPAVAFATPRHQRSVSEQTNGYKQYPSRLAQAASVDGYEPPPPPPPHGVVDGNDQHPEAYELADTDPPSPSPDSRDFPELQIAPTAPPQGPVESPPLFEHAPGQKPPVKPQHAALMKPNTHMDSATLHQMADATNTPLPPGIASAGAAAAWKSQDSLSGRGHLNGDADQTHLYANPQYNRSGHSANRLPTIPASPYIEHEQFVDSPTVYQPAAPPVPEHAELPLQSTSQGHTDGPLPGSGGSHQVHRKPVPGPSSVSLRGEDARSIRSTASSSLGSAQYDVVEPEALDRLHDADPVLLRQSSYSSSRYSRDDAMSTSTPDYASTIEEEDEPPSRPAARLPERARNGMLKFVGNPELNPKPEVVVGDVHYKPGTKPTGSTSDVPAFDFGPTYSLDPGAKRPGTSGTMTQNLQNDRFSQSRENLAPSPSEQKRLSYTGSTTPTTTQHMRGSSASPQSWDNRSVAWQPGMAAQPQSDKYKLDPEEWVAQRASIAGPPRAPAMYGHGRSKSHTPPLSRVQSGDWSHLVTPETGPARPPSRPLSRPLSRGAERLLDQRPSSRGAERLLDQRPSSRGAERMLDQRPLSRGAERLLDQRPTSLSAREQEHVARMTNTPLIDLSKNPKKEQKPTSAGLTAYIDHREKEKAAAKSNQHSLAMQAEIDRRTMAARQRQMMEMQQMGQQMQMDPQMATTPGSFGTPTMVGTPQGYQQGFAYSTPGQMRQNYQQQGYFPQQSMQQGWPAPTPLQPMPGQYPQTPGQYFMPQQQQQQQQPVTQPYGASFDQAQAAARYAHQQQQYGRQ